MYFTAVTDFNHILCVSSEFLYHGFGKLRRYQILRTAIFTPTRNSSRLRAAGYFLRKTLLTLEKVENVHQIGCFLLVDCYIVVDN